MISVTHIVSHLVLIKPREVVTTITFVFHMQAPELKRLHLNCFFKEGAVPFGTNPEELVTWDLLEGALHNVLEHVYML